MIFWMFQAWVLSSERPFREAADGPPVSEEKLSVFRDFINSLDIDDLGKKRDD